MVDILGPWLFLQAYIPKEISRDNALV